VSRDSRDTNRSSFISDYGDTCGNVFRHQCNIGVKPTHPFVTVALCFEVFHCEIHGMVRLLQINMLPLYRLRKWGRGQLYAEIFTLCFTFYLCVTNIMVSIYWSSPGPICNTLHFSTDYCNCQSLAHASTISKAFCNEMQS